MFVTSWPHELFRWNFSPVNKINTSVASAHAQLNHFETCSDQFLAFQNNFLVSQIRGIVIPWNFLKYVSLTKEVDWWHNFKFLMTSKTDFCSVYYTPVALPSQWRHQLSSFHKGYPWYKFKVHIIPRSCGISGGAPRTHLVALNLCSTSVKILATEFMMVKVSKKLNLMRKMSTQWNEQLIR